MTDPVTAFQEEPAARGLARRLSLLPGATREFDLALVNWLTAYVRAMDGVKYRGPIPGLDTREDQQLDLAIGAGGAPLGTYAWARLWKAQDGLCSFIFTKSFTGPRLARHLEHAALGPTSRRDVLACFEYLRDVADSPNSGLRAALWSVARHFKVLADPASRQEALQLFIDLARRRKFHHNLSDLCTVLGEVRPEDEILKRQLFEFTPANSQGAALLVTEVIRVVGFASNAARPGKPLVTTIRWLTGVRTREPREQWHRKRGEVLDVVGPARINRICQWVREHPELGRDAATGWRDDLFWSAWKSASWHLGLEVGSLP